MIEVSILRRVIIEMDISNIRKNEPLSKHSTFGVGGLAKYFFEASDIDDVPEIIAWVESQGMRYFVMGIGSNILFKDSGFDGLVVKITAKKISAEGDTVIADAGAPIAAVAKFACDNDRGGMEEFISLPGTVGGAVYGNAGCFWKEVSDVLTRGWVLKDGKLTEVDSDYFKFKYRWSALKDSHEILLKAAFRTEGGCEKSRMKDVLAVRREKQPWGKTAGCFFKNPGSTPELSAGFLIDKCGLKGKTVGGAKISMKHANFILNTGDATASDILELADMAKKAVKGQFNIDLDPEIQIIG
ncbi:UDP-N-acetylenolpyruvoylglucosamine reductase [Candidatus Peregrinibacteria bacterium CG22_combo_CG10-13_8_21_14_all_44_10]|nr:MAG: UDP-N-acetylenolpyruvoylglucosamine reductase [Candidatus Peregrinibacteria bacterium CG22_combo_CG10-13_8_21_14_all_44_10]